MFICSLIIVSLEWNSLPISVCQCAYVTQLKSKL